MSISLVSTHLVTICLDSVLYGIFFVLFLTSTSLLLLKQRKQNPDHPNHLRWRHWRSPMVLVGVAIFLCVTTHWILGIVRVFYIFNNSRGGIDPELLFTNISRHIHLAYNSVFELTALISDAMMVYRLWVFWEYNKPVVAVPALAWVGLAVIGPISVYHHTGYVAGVNPYSGIMGHLATCNAALTLCTNIYCTAFISGRISYAVLHAWPSSPLKSVMVDTLAIIIQSAALYTAWVLFYLITYNVQSPTETIALSTWSCIAGISYMLINVRVGMGWSQSSRDDKAAVEGALRDWVLRSGIEAEARTDSNRTVEKSDSHP